MAGSRQKLRTAILTVLALTAGTIAYAQVGPAAWPFLDRIKASTDAGLLWPNAAPDEPAALFLAVPRYRQHIMGMRFLADRKRTPDIIQGALNEFGQDCVSAGGSVADWRTPTGRAFADWTTAQLDQHRPVYPWEYYDWTGVCLSRSDMPIAAFLGVRSFNRRNTTEVRKKGVVVGFTRAHDSRIAVYLLSPELLRTDREYRELLNAEKVAEREKLERRREYELARLRENVRWHGEWRKTITLGTRTNCGMVVQERGPLVEVQLPAGIEGPGGIRQFWVRRDRLTDDDVPNGCDFGR